MYEHQCIHCNTVNKGMWKQVQYRVTVPRKVGLGSWADQTMAAHSLSINKGREGKEVRRQNTV